MRSCDLVADRHHGGNVGAGSAPANEPRFGAYQTNRLAVLSEIADARRRGYGVREIGLVRGTKSISTWIRKADGNPAAALTVSAVRTRLGPRLEQQVVETLLKAAYEVDREFVEP